MPIKIPNSLPARKTLEGENIFVMTEYRAIHQDIRPLKLLILNLMPTKVATETQLLRKFSNTPLQTQIELLQTVSHDAQNVDRSHLESFYTSFGQIKDKYYDGLVITGAPVENMTFEDVDYWQELCQIMEWSKTHVHSTLHICWGAQAGLYYHYGIPKYSLPKKVFGVFDHKVLKPSSPLFRGLTTAFMPLTPGTPRCWRRTFGKFLTWKFWLSRKKWAFSLSKPKIAASSSSWVTWSMIGTPWPRSTAGM